MLTWNESSFFFKEGMNLNVLFDSLTFIISMRCLVFLNYMIYTIKNSKYPTNYLVMEKNKLQRLELKHYKIFLRSSRIFSNDKIKTPKYDVFSYILKCIIVKSSKCIH